MIDYQCQSSSGGGMDLTIVATPGASVTLTKGSYNKTLVADDNGLVTFKKLANGTYLAVSKLGDLTPVEKEIVILNQKQEYMPQGKMLRDMELGTKVLFGGMKFVLRGLNHEGYPSKSATLQLKVSNLAPIPFDTRGNTNNKWSDSSLRTYLNGDFLNTFLQIEKEMILETTIKTYETYLANPYETTDKVFVGSAAEMIGRTDDEGSPLYYLNNDDKKLFNANNAATNHWTRTISNAAGGPMIIIDGNGNASTFGPTHNSVYVSPIINLKDTTIISKEPNNEGYYVVQLPPTKIVDLPLGAKVKMGGYKFKIVDKNHEGYPSNSVQLFSTHSMGDSPFKTIIGTSYKNSNLMNAYTTYCLPKFTENEKQYMLKTTFKQKGEYDIVDTFEEYFVTLSSTELGIRELNDGIEGVKFDYFKTNADRVVTGATQYWSRTRSSSASVLGVKSDGTLVDISKEIIVQIAACLSVSNEMIVEYDADGYWKVKE